MTARIVTTFSAAFAFGLGHQSWQSELGRLLEVYPEFDETPWIELPEEYEGPNADGLYSKSYCPLHPGEHEVVFALVDELVKAFDVDAFLDQYLGRIPVPSVENDRGGDPVACAKTVFEEFRKLDR